MFYNFANATVVLLLRYCSVGAHLSRSTSVSRSVTHVFVNIYICDNLEMRQMCSTHNRKGTQSTFVSHFSIIFLKVIIMPICIPATSHCSVFSVFIVPFLGHFRSVKKIPDYASESYIELKSIPVLHVTMKISTSAASRT
jgi:hypothetical protein